MTTNIYYRAKRNFMLSTTETVGMLTLIIAIILLISSMLTCKSAIPPQCSYESEELVLFADKYIMQVLEPVNCVNDSLIRVIPYCGGESQWIKINSVKPIN